jgi:hypothetical protein
MKLLGVNMGMNVGTLALGAAAVLLGPTMLAVAGGLAKSVAKAGIKGGIMIYDKGKEIAVEAKETAEDLAAEARSEVSQSKKAPSAKK